MSSVILSHFSPYTKTGFCGILEKSMQNLRHKLYQLLRGSEHFFKTDMVYVAKSGFWVTFGQILTSTLSLVLVIVVANLLPKETYGLYRYVLSLASVFNIFTLTGMNRAVAQAAAIGNEGALRTSVRYQIKWNVIMLLAFWSLSLFYFVNGNLLLSISILILSFFVPLTSAFSTYSAYLDGIREFRLNNIFSVISNLMYVAGIILAIIFSGQVPWLVFAYALATFTSSLIFYITTIRLFKSPINTADDSFLKYGKKLTWIGLLSPIVSQIDKIVLSHFWGPIQLAVYSLATAVPDRATNFIKSWVSIGFPKLANKTRKEIDAVFYRRIFQGLSIGILVTIAYILVAPYVFKYLLPQYLDATFYSQILALSFIFAMPNRYVSLILESQKLSKVIFIRSLIQSLIMILLYIILGIWGGILGLVIAQVLNAFTGMLINIAMWRFIKV